jgi:hypothetical protein
VLHMPIHQSNSEHASVTYGDGWYDGFCSLQFI